MVTKRSRTTKKTPKTKSKSKSKPKSRNMPTPRTPTDVMVARNRAATVSNTSLLQDDELGREMGEEFVRSVTSGDHSAEEMRDEDLPEENGGPFVTTTAAEEFAEGTDESNPADAEVEAVPTVSVLQQK